MVLFLGQNWHRKLRGKKILKKQKITFFWKISLFFFEINEENIKKVGSIPDNGGIVKANKIPFQENLGKIFSQNLGQKIPKNI